MPKGIFHRISNGQATIRDKCQKRATDPAYKKYTYILPEMFFVTDRK